MKIKVCGMKDAANIQALLELEPDYMGLIFYAPSKRYVDDTDLSLLENRSAQIKVTGVFVNEMQEVVLQKVRKFHLKAIQLHGDETPAYCHDLRIALNRNYLGTELIKAFGMDETFDFAVLEAYQPKVDFFLFDTNTPAHGGSGIKFNWQVLEKYHQEKSYFLSGGISIDDLIEVKKLNDPRLYAVDLNSKFETSPGFKNIEQVSRAIDILRSS